MFGWGPATRIYLAAGATDMRKGFEGLYGLARDRLSLEPLSGHVFVFANARRNRLKLLFWDGSGLWVCANQPSSHYTSSGSSPTRWASARTVSARSTSRSHRLQCLTGGFGPGSS
jgi:hypothetical protein